MVSPGNAHRGRTPLARALYVAMETLETERLKDRDVLPLLVLLSDGRANVSLAGDQLTQLAAGDVEVQNLGRTISDAKIPAVVVDTEQDFIKLGLAQGIADSMSARCIKLEELAAESLADAVRRELPGEVEAAPVVT